MALKLAKEVNGYTAEYWRIDRYSIEKGKTYAWVRLGLYKDSKYAALQDAKPVLTLEKTFGGKDFPIDFAEVSKEGNNETKALYNKVKEPVIQINPETKEETEINTNELSNAEDC